MINWEEEDSNPIRDSVFSASHTCDIMNTSYLLRNIWHKIKTITSAEPRQGTDSYFTKVNVVCFYTMLAGCFLTSKSENCENCPTLTDKNS